MKEDRARWNKKYRSGDFPRKPSGIVKRYHGLVCPGRVLDIAAGAGRNALYLAGEGHEVDAVDISDAAMETLEGKDPRVHPLCRDLDSYTISHEQYDLILNIRYLNRRLFPGIIKGLKRGGVLIFETYTEKIGEKGHPIRKNFLLRENELLHTFISLKILFYEEEEGAGPTETDRSASLVARKK